MAYKWGITEHLLIGMILQVYKTNIAPENGRLEVGRWNFLLGPAYFQVRSVSFREGNYSTLFGELNFYPIEFGCFGKKTFNEQISLDLKLFSKDNITLDSPNAWCFIKNYEDMIRQRDEFHALTPAPRPPKTNSLPLKHESYKTFFSFWKCPFCWGTCQFSGYQKKILLQYILPA